MRPIFILSLPRSGSTWVQRVLSGHEHIATASEPWLLMAPLLPISPVSGGLDWGIDHIQEAAKDVTCHLPNGIEDYYTAVKEFAVGLYAKLNTKESSRYFLDKTPRYYFIAQHLLKIFPDAKVIFLWRNPLAVAGSIYETWGRKRKIGISRSYVDLYKGVDLLVEAQRQMKHKSISVRYEDLIQNPSDSWSKIYSYLELEVPGSFQPAHTLRGSMGDKTLISKHDDERILGWRESFRPCMRRKWALEYLDWLNDAHLDCMGFDRGDILADLRSVPTSYAEIPGDIIRIMRGRLYEFVDGDVFKKKKEDRLKYGKSFLNT